MTDNDSAEATPKTEFDHCDLQTLPKAPVGIWRCNETGPGRFVRCGVNFVVAMLTVLAVLPLAYLVDGMDGVQNLQPIIEILFLIVALVGALCTIFVIATPNPAAGLANGHYFARWQLDHSQQRSVRSTRRQKLWKQYLIAASLFGLVGLGIGSGTFDRSAVAGHGEMAHIVSVVLGCAAIGMTICSFLQWRQRGVNGLADLQCPEVLIGPGGIYLAGIHTPLELLARVYQASDSSGELQFEFHEPNGSVRLLSVPFPADQSDLAGQLQSFMNEHDAASLGMFVAEMRNADATERSETPQGGTYSYKLNASPSRYNLRLTDHSIEVFDEAGAAVREIEFSQVKWLHEYDGINAVDPQTGSYKTEFCRIKVLMAKSLTIRNGSYLSPNGRMGELSSNQHAQFKTFAQELKRRIAVVHPNVPVCTGWMIVSVCCLIVALVGLFFGLIAFGPVETIGGRIGMIGVAALMGGPLVWFGGRGAISYWPRRIPVSESVQQGDDFSANTVGNRR